MTNHERYKEAFAKLDTGVTPAQIRALAEDGKGEPIMKHKRALHIALIAALAVLLLAGTVTAAGVSGGWLLPALSNAGVDSALLEKVMHPAVSATVGNERWTVDELLIEGNVVYMQYTRQSLDGSPIPQQQEGADWLLYWMDADGTSLSDTQGSTGYLTDDNGDPSRRVELRSFECCLNGREPDWEHTTLLLYLDNASLFPRLMYSAPVGTPLYRTAALEDGTPVKIGRLTLELDPTEITRAMDADYAVILSDGTEIVCGGGMGTASPQQGLTPGSTVQLCLPRIIDPAAVTALRIGGETYPITDAGR